MRLFYVIIIIALAFPALAQKSIIKASGDVSDIIVDKNLIIASTVNGTIETFDIKSHRLISKVRFGKIKDFTGELVNVEVFKLLKIGPKLFAIVHGENGFNDIYEINGNIKNRIITGSSLNAVAISIKCCFDNQLIIGLLSNEIVKYNLKSSRITYRKQISSYAFSDMVVDEKGQFAYSSDESGEIHKIDLKTGIVKRTFKGQNVDNVISLAYSSGLLIGGGKDRRLSIYNTKTGRAFYKNTNSFVHAVGISPSGAKVVYYDDETNGLVVFNTHTNSKVKTLLGHKSMVTRILFITENRLVSSGIDRQIILWNI